MRARAACSRMSDADREWEKQLGEGAERNYWEALLGKSAEEDWNAQLGESGYELKIVNRRRGREAEQWFYDIVVVRGPLYAIYRQVTVGEGSELHVNDEDQARSTDILQHRSMMIWWTYESHSQKREQVSRDRANRGMDVVRLYSERIKPTTERWEAMWEARLPLLRRALSAFFRGELVDVQEHFLDNMLRWYWREDGPWLWAYC